MARPPAAVASLLAICLVTACGACASGAGAPADTARTGPAATPATPARPAADARLETASLRRGGTRADGAASLWTGCGSYEDRISCPDASFRLDMFTARRPRESPPTTVAEARTGFGGDWKPVDIDGVPAGHAFVQVLPRAAGFAHAPVKDWAFLPLEASAAGVPRFDCWSRVGSTAGEDFCREAGAHFTAGTLPTEFPERNKDEVALFGTTTEVFEGGHSPGHGAMVWSDGSMHLNRYDSQAAALKARAGSLADAKSYSSADIFDFRCAVAGFEGDCVLVQSRVGSTRRVVRAIASALRGPGDDWYLFTCMLFTYQGVLEASYEASCGTVVEILPSE